MLMWISFSALPCPKLKIPDNGHFIPSSCTTGKSPPSHHCILACNKGYKVQGRAVLTCLASQKWNRLIPGCSKGRFNHRFENKVHIQTRELTAKFISEFKRKKQSPELLQAMDFPSKITATLSV